MGRKDKWIILEQCAQRAHAAGECVWAIFNVPLHFAPATITELFLFPLEPLVLRSL